MTTLGGADPAGLTRVAWRLSHPLIIAATVSGCALLAAGTASLSTFWVLAGLAAGFAISGSV